MSLGKTVQSSQEELAALAENVLSTAANVKLTDEVRARLQSELASREFATLRPYAGSLVQDADHPGDYYLAVDAIGGAELQSLLIALRSGVASNTDRFGDPILTLATRSASG